MKQRRKLKAERAREEKTVVLKRELLGFFLDSSPGPAVNFLQTHDSTTATSNRRWRKPDKP